MQAGRELLARRRPVEARVVELDTSLGIRRGVSRGLTVLDAWRSEGPLPSFTPTTWLGAGAIAGRQRGAGIDPACVPARA